MSEYIIGVDPGNFFIQPCYIQGINPVTKRGGVFYDLVNPSSNTPYGIPSAFYYSKERGIVCGDQALRELPKSNCIRYLKRDLFKNGKPNSITIDGRTFTYDEMIVAAAQYAIRVAADQLEKQLHIKTNKIAISYPASISSYARNHLINLMERVTLEDGTKVKVVGTIAEPAAAALDYLAVMNSNKEETVVVADLGAGTFDVSVVRVYPQGRQYSDKKTYYYDPVVTDGIEDLGGKEFDEVVAKILSRKAGVHAKVPYVAEMIRNESEPVKRELTISQDGVVRPNIMLPNGNFIDPITRDEFEKEAMPLVERILEMVDATINANKDATIDHLVLTGGASQMPIIKKMFEKRFPAFKDKIGFHMPSKAIASGAARFGTQENHQPVSIRTIRDLGVTFFDDENDAVGHMVHYLDAGTTIPCESGWINGYKLAASQQTNFTIREGRVSNPDTHQVERDYQFVHSHSHDHGEVRPKGYHTQSRIIIDERHMAFLEVREPDAPHLPSKIYPFTIDLNNNS